MNWNEFNKNFKFNINMFNKKENYFVVIINIENFVCLIDKIGSDKSDNILYKLYNYCKGISDYHYLENSTRMYLFFNKKNTLEKIKKEVEDIIKKYNQLLVQHTKNDGILKNNLVLQIIIDEIKLPIEEWFVNTFLEKYDKLFYHLNTIKSTNYIFDVINFNLNSYEVQK